MCAYIFKLSENGVGFINFSCDDHFLKTGRFFFGRIKNSLRINNRMNSTDRLIYMLHVILFQEYVIKVNTFSLTHHDYNLQLNDFFLGYIIDQIT